MHSITAEQINTRNDTDKETRTVCSHWHARNNHPLTGNMHMIYEKKRDSSISDHNGRYWFTGKDQQLSPITVLAFSDLYYWT